MFMPPTVPRSPSRHSIGSALSTVSNDHQRCVARRTAATTPSAIKAHRRSSQSLGRTDRPKLSGRSELAAAFRYMLARWPALIRCLDDGRLSLDNNPAERALRGVAIGRKNYLFAGSDRRRRTGRRHVLPHRDRQAQWHRSGSLFARCPRPHRRPPEQSYRRTPAVELAASRAGRAAA